MREFIPVLAVVAYFCAVFLIWAFISAASKGPHVHPAARFKARQGGLGWLRRFIGGGR